MEKLLTDLKLALYGILPLSEEEIQQVEQIFKHTIEDARTDSFEFMKLNPKKVTLEF